MNSARAKAVIEYRTKHGDFISRDQIKKVKGVGDKVWTQCSGFLRIVPRSGDKASSKINLLDRTQIHPESYNIATKIISLAKLSSENIGEGKFCKTMVQFACSQDIDQLSAKLGAGVETVKMINEALQQNLEYDYRAEFTAPLFKSGLSKVEDLKVGDILTGRVSNVTHLGAFVDIGVGINGLIHTSKMRGRFGKKKLLFDEFSSAGHKLELGNRVEVTIQSLELERKRIGLWKIRTV